MARQGGLKTTMAGALALGAITLAPAAAFAQAAVNPSDVLAPAERETFSFTFRTQAQTDANIWTLDESPELELSAGQKWRFTLDLDSRNVETFEIDGLRACAFFDITPRMSLGGALSFTDEDSAITNAGDFGDDVPEVKFESAFRF